MNQSLIPLILYLGIMLYIAYRVGTKRSEKGADFQDEYFIGSRSMGGFVLAMTIVATYASASSFIGGPGIAYQMGYGWVLLSSIQIPASFLTLGILGKKLAIVSRKIGGVTINDYLRKRYNSDFIVVFSSIIMIVFFLGVIVVQFIGGAKLLEAVMGVPYTVGLLIFSIIVIIYTTIGGFRAVVLTDAIQGSVMIIATLCLLYSIIKVGGGIENINQNILATNPDMLRPLSGGKLGASYLMSFWVLVGVGILGLPQTTVRCMGFKDSKSMHRAMIVGTIVIGILMIGLPLIGVLGAGVYPGLDVGDKLIPVLALKTVSPLLVGVFIGGPIAAMMSTVDSMIILTSASIIKDLYVNYGSGKKVSDRSIEKITKGVTLTLGILGCAFALNPPKFLVMLNLFALGGLEAGFLCPVIGGLYWKRANKIGATASMVVGVVSYIYMTVVKTNIYGMHPIVPAIIVAIIVFILGSFIGKKEESLEI